MTDNNPPTSSLDSSAVRDIHRVMNHRKEAEALDRGKGIPPCYAAYGVLISCRPQSAGIPLVARFHRVAGRLLKDG